MRVLLEELDISNTQELLFSSKNGFVLESPSHEHKKAPFAHNELKVLLHKQQLYITCPDGKLRKLKHNDLLIENPYQRRIMFKDKAYEGKLYLKLDTEKKTLFIINRVDLESYIYSVLRSESIPYWPLEMHKIQAITSRSYCMYLIKNQRPKNSLYDIKNSNFNQLYNGHHRCKHLYQAVHETEGLILAYQTSPVLAMFDVACGGIIPGLMRHIDPSKPYLYRMYRCTYCIRNKSCFIWKEDLHENKFLSFLKSHAHLGKEITTLGALKNIKIIDQDKAGIVHKIQLIGSKNSVTFSSKMLKSSIKGRFTSLAIAIKKERDRVVITGKGHGHHLGLCQCGARELIARGWDYKKILHFYFPHTRLARLL